MSDRVATRTVTREIAATGTVWMTSIIGFEDRFGLVDEHGIAWQISPAKWSSVFVIPESFGDIGNSLAPGGERVVYADSRHWKFYAATFADFLRKQVAELREQREGQLQELKIVAGFLEKHGDSIAPFCTHGTIYGLIQQAIASHAPPAPAPDANLIAAARDAEAKLRGTACYDSIAREVMNEVADALAAALADHDRQPSERM